MSPGLPSTIQLQPWPDPTSQPARVGWPGARLTKPPASFEILRVLHEACTASLAKNIPKAAWSIRTTLSLEHSRIALQEGSACICTSSL
eukprot:CAMPEP_0206545376 /NCGR_PEP_ID=MMETSP0325_2-20121206/12099_1 /ASSEMBLY_ACC=CAM_ASM_000347 /TAXON_ID=2866 /ORGANISM="Crypthecodinium cohnii, Strain Seligo" /LENGTH=88 /DNA_ID=CAMNT_0054044349 /DNA_START=1126 /DNA_END=1392 /DNA_ORIENTATION=+